MSAAQLIDRKGVASLLDCSVRSVCNNERKLGLADCKIMLNARLVRYKRQAAMEALRRRGLVSS